MAAKAKEGEEISGDRRGCLMAMSDGDVWRRCLAAMGCRAGRQPAHAAAARFGRRAGQS